MLLIIILKLGGAENGPGNEHEAIPIPLQRVHPAESQLWSGLLLQNQFELPGIHRTPVIIERHVE